MLALLLRGGRPYKELIEARGVFLPVEAGVKFGSIPRHVEVAVERDPAYNCHRRCVFWSSYTACAYACHTGTFFLPLSREKNK